MKTEFYTLNSLLIEAQELSPFWWDVYEQNESLCERIINLVDQSDVQAYTIAKDYFADFNY